METRYQKYYRLHRQEIAAKRVIKLQAQNPEYKKRVLKIDIGEEAWAEHRRKIVRKSRISWSVKVRRQLLEILGNKCGRCGFDDVRALQIDHIKGDGCIQRRYSKSGSFIYKEMLQDPELLLKFQCLCANCNWIKRAEEKEYGMAHHLKALKFNLEGS